ncbi:hypothetical protein G7085_19755 [Tessaracoccus sp. HDW20]|nr:hypothetical protein [Tessaracoccus coleopterorum]NHB86015.1 hypothetical protein [Tessaracoccus coleopterorum]
MTGPLAQLLVDELGADCGVAVGAATEAGIQLAIDGGAIRSRTGSR